MPAPPFRTRAELASWLEKHGISHVARLSLEVVVGAAPADLRAHLRSVTRRRRLVEVASADAAAAARDWLERAGLRETIQGLVSDFLERERADAETARAEVPARLTPPDEPAAVALHSRLVAVRETFPATVAPRPSLALGGKAFQTVPDLPGFRFQDPRPFEPHVVSARGFIESSVDLVLSEAGARLRCTCGEERCVHGLATIDGALVWLKQPPSPAFAKDLSELGRPAWERTVLALGRALDTPPADRSGIELTWLLSVSNETEVEVRPWLTRIGSKEKRGAGTSPGRRQLLGEHRADLSADDARIGALLPELSGPASRPLLEALIGHTRVVLDDAPERPVRVERAVVGLVAEQRGGSVRVSAAVDGSALPVDLVSRLRRADPGDVPFLWDGGCLTLLEAKAELRPLLDVLARDGALFPPESQPALLEVLSRWAERVPVVMPRSVLGESTPALLTPVLRLQVQVGGAVEVELRVRPLAGGPALVPGHGARDVHVRRGERAFHAARDLDRERDVFEKLALALLPPELRIEDQPFAYRLEGGTRVLTLLDACAQRAEPPELEWIGEPIRRVGSAGPRALRVTLERTREWFGVLGGLSVEGERIELARLLDAVRRKERYVRVTAHSYVEVTDALREHLAELEAHTRDGRRGLEVGPSAIPILAAMETSGVVLDADEAWRDLRARIIASRESWAPVPRDLQAELRPYQVEGFRWLASLSAWGAGGILGDDMGLGKTLQALALILHRRDLGPAVVVAPTSVVFNWKDEAARFAPSLRVVTYGEQADRDATIEGLGPGDVALVSYGLLVRDAGRLATVHFATAVFDEAQSLKNAVTQRARAARSLDAEMKVALSGTPVENHTGELWSLFSLVFPELLGSWEAFRARYSVPIEKQLEPGAVAALGRVIAPFLLRRTKRQVESELPPRTDVRVPVVLSAAEWQLYEDTRLAVLSDLHTSKGKLREQQRKVQVLAALTRLRLVACHPRLHDSRSDLVSAKLERLLELVTELGLEGQRALVFSQFTSHLALVREAIESRGIPYVYLDGETPPAARADRVREFQDGAAPLFLISLKAGGFGLNLTAATNVIHLDPWWNPSVEDQASDRAHRIGQTRPVTVYRLVSVGTIEEQMLALHQQKRALVAEILDGKDGGGRVSTDDLLDLLGESRLGRNRVTASGPS